MLTPLIEIVEKLPRSRIVLIGDLMLDRYVYGDAERLSPDAPVPVLQFRREDARLGGAGRVAADLATLRADVRVVSIVGDDATGRVAAMMLVPAGIDAVLGVLFVAAYLRTPRSEIPVTSTPEHAVTERAT